MSDFENEVQDTVALGAAEKALLGASIDDPANFDEVRAKLTAADFSFPDHKRLFEALIDEMDDVGRIEPISLACRLERSNNVLGALALVRDCLVNASGVEALAGHIRVTLQASVDRTTSMLASEMVRNPSKAESISSQIRIERERLDDSVENTSISSAAFDYVSYLQALNEQDSDITGVSTGFIDLDEKTSGLQPGDLIIIAGRPSMGKTALSLNLAKNIGVMSQADLETGAAATKHVVYFSLEMGTRPVMPRLIACDSGVEFKRLLQPKQLTDDDYGFMSKSLSRMHASSMFIEENPRYKKVSAIRKRVSDLTKQLGKLDLVVIDYLQLMEPDDGGENRNQDVERIAIGLKNIAKEFNVPVVALSQLSRKVEERTDKRPVMSDLRESGGIEQTADVIMLLYREKYYKPDSPDDVIEVIIGKQRQGETGVVPLLFDGRYQCCRNLAKDYEGSSRPGRSASNLRAVR